MRYLIAETFDQGREIAVGLGWEPFGLLKFQDSDGCFVIIQRFNPHVLRGVNNTVIYKGPNIDIPDKMSWGRHLIIVKVEDLRK